MEDNDLGKPPMWQEPHKIYKIAEEPKYAGYYQLDGGYWKYRLALERKPLWLCRKLIWLLLGIKWIDNK